MTNHFHLIIINTNEYAMLLLHSANGSYRCLASNLKSGKSENQRQKLDQTALVFLVCFWRIFFERRIIRIRSVQEPPADGAPYGPNVRKCLDHALAVSKGLGFRTTDLDHQMGWCEFGEGDEMIAVLGHLDVVPEGEGWTFDPFR